MGHLTHVWRFVHRTPWAILPEKGEELLAVLELRSSGGRFSAEELAARVGEPKVPTTQIAGAIAVLPLYGILVQRAGMITDYSGGTSTQQFAAQLGAVLRDPAIDAVVLDVASPGGSVYGIVELADQVFAARGTKPIIAVANSMAASAAYWIATQADELVVTPGGEVGSIGVYSMHQDVSQAEQTAGRRTTFISAGKYKTEGNPFEPLSEEARAALQQRVDELYGMFVDAVARGRGATPDAVRNGFGQGRMVGAERAIAGGMADRIETLDQTLARLAGDLVSQKQRAGAAGAVARAGRPDAEQELALRRRQLDLENTL